MTKRLRPSAALGVFDHVLDQISHVLGNGLDDGKGLLENVAHDVGNGHSKLLCDATDVLSQWLRDPCVKDALLALARPAISSASLLAVCVPTTSLALGFFSFARPLASLLFQVTGTFALVLFPFIRELPSLVLPLVSNLDVLLHPLSGQIAILIAIVSA